MCTSIPKLGGGGSGGMLPQENFEITTFETVSGECGLLL